VLETALPRKRMVLYMVASQPSMTPSLPVLLLPPPSAGLSPLLLASDEGGRGGVVLLSVDAGLLLLLLLLRNASRRSKRSMTVSSRVSSRFWCRARKGGHACQTLNPATQRINRKYADGA
jgi:hypothetical protein